MCSLSVIKEFFPEGERQTWIDLFDADVIACKQMLIDIEKSQKVGGWFG